MCSKFFTLFFWLNQNLGFDFTVYSTLDRDHTHIYESEINVQNPKKERNKTTESALFPMSECQFIVGKVACTRSLSASCDVRECRANPQLRGCGAAGRGWAWGGRGD